MSEQNEAREERLLEVQSEPEAKSPAERERVPKIESRFLYVDIASRRAKQLRRGALPRVDSFRFDTESGTNRSVIHKLERIAMSEVDEGLIIYELPELPAEETS